MPCVPCSVWSCEQPSDCSLWTMKLSAMRLSQPQRSSDTTLTQVIMIRCIMINRETSNHGYRQKATALSELQTSRVNGSTNVARMFACICLVHASHTSLVFISEIALVASSGVESCTKPTPRLMPVLGSRSTLHDMMVPNSCRQQRKRAQAAAIYP